MKILKRERDEQDEWNIGRKLAMEKFDLKPISREDMKSSIISQKYSRDE